MSRKVKEMMIREYRQRLGQAREAMLISVRGIKAMPAVRLRRTLAQRQVRVTVVRNTLARRALADTPLEPITRLFEGPSALAWGDASVVEIARELLRLAETIPQLELRGAVLDGQVFEGRAGVEELARYPTRQEAQGRIAAAVGGVGPRLSATLAGPGAMLAMLLKAIEERLQKGETITRRNA